MGTIPTSDLGPGMVLASDLRSPQGRLLLPKGMTLTESHIKTCKAWGILEADIRNVSLEDAQARANKRMDPEVLAVCRELADFRFSNADHDYPAQQELIRQFTLWAARQLEAGGQSAKLELPAPPPTPTNSSLPELPEPEDLVSEATHLASLPEVYSQIVAALNDPFCSASRVAEVVGRDGSLSARLLKLVNSPFYGFHQQIGSLNRAVALVGSNSLTSLAVGVSVISLFNDVPAQYFTMQEFWRHSVTCGIVARHLASHLDGMDQERAFSAGLMHDIGRLVMLMEFPAHSRAALGIALYERRPLDEVEREMWGFDHSAVTRALLDEWALPQTMVRAVGEHHLPPGMEPEREGAVLHVADIIAHALDPDLTARMVVPSLRGSAWSVLGLPPSILASAFTLSHSQVEDTITVFLGEAA